MQPEEIEIQLWEYIDGTCSNADKERISLMISTNSAWKQQYTELLAMHSMMQANLTPLHTGNAFTDNVMAQLTPVTQSSTKRLLNLSIKAVACFFIIAMAGLSVYAVAVTDWNFSAPATTINLPELDFALPESGFNISSSGVAIAGFSAVVFLLMMADNIFRKSIPGKL